MLDQLIGLYIVCGVLKAHTHTRSFVFGHIQKRERERETGKGALAPARAVLCTLCSGCAWGEIHPAKKKINTAAAAAAAVEKQKRRGFARVP